LNTVHPVTFHFYDFFYSSTALVGSGPLVFEVPRLHSVRHTTLGRTPLDELSVNRRDLYTTLSRDRLPCPRTAWDLHSQEASGGAAMPSPRGHRDRPHFYEIHLNIIILQISASQTVSYFRIFLLQLCVRLLYPPRKLQVRPHHSRIDRINNVW